MAFPTAHSLCMFPSLPMPHSLHVFITLFLHPLYCLFLPARVITHHACFFYMVGCDQIRRSYPTRARLLSALRSGVLCKPPRWIHVRHPPSPGNSRSTFARRCAPTVDSTIISKNIREIML
ncbi:hypothetical protein C8Q74DRAFT_158032 [Fomes fomentarius]|nr:hypothetical protein C8Q74DRAFT_158032 [Fomes fomentarius]